MSRTTREINKITTAVICISVKLIVYALIILLLYEAVTRGFAFGHEIFTRRQWMRSLEGMCRWTYLRMIP